MRREDHAVDAGRLCGPQERSDVLGILERVEHEDEWRLAPLHRSGEDIVDAGIGPRLDDEGDPLVAIEAGERGQGPALDLDDRDTEAGRVQDEPLQRLASLRDDEQAMGRPARDERLLDGATAGDELFVVAEVIGWRDRRAEAGLGAGSVRPRSARTGPPSAAIVGPGSLEATPVEWPTDRAGATGKVGAPGGARIATRRRAERTWSRAEATARSRAEGTPRLRPGAPRARAGRSSPEGRARTCRAVAREPVARSALIVARPTRLPARRSTAIAASRGRRTGWAIPGPAVTRPSRAARVTRVARPATGSTRAPARTARPRPAPGTSHPGSLAPRIRTTWAGGVALRPAEAEPAPGHGARTATARTAAAAGAGTEVAG